MSASLKMHPEHGLNATVIVCFWCGEPTGEIEFIGNRTHEKAPEQTCHDYIPCPDCQAQMARGFTFVEVVDMPLVDNQDEIIPGFYPTGRMAVTTIEFAKANLTDETLEKLGGVNRAVIDSGLWNRLGLPTEYTD